MSSLQKIAARIHEPTRAQAAAAAPMDMQKLAAAQSRDEFIEKLASALNFAADSILQNIEPTGPQYQQAHGVTPDRERLAHQLREKIARKSEVQVETAGANNREALQRIVARLQQTTPDEHDGGSARSYEQEVDPIEQAIQQAAREAQEPESHHEHVQQVAAMPSASLADVLEAALEAKGTSDSAERQTRSAETPMERAVESAKTASANGKGPVTVGQGSEAIKAALAARRLSGGKA